MKTLTLVLSLLLSASLLAGADTLSLDGTWQIIFDPGNSGRTGSWQLDEPFSKHPAIREIQVPSCWEEIEKDYEGVAFYRHKFQVPANWKGKTIRLHFDAVNFRAEVWLNDQAAGFHEGGFSPFEFRVEQVVKPGEENTVTLRVAGPILMTDQVIEGVGQMETPQWRGAITGGIWQPVKLIATGKTYVKDVFVEPKIADNTATFHVEFEHNDTKLETAQAQVTIGSASQPNQVVARKEETLELKPGRNKRSWTLEIPNATYWSPGNPHLYRAEVSVAYGGETSDTWSTRLGLREFTVRDRKFYLNGQPLYLKATFFEGLYPVKLAYPDSREMAVREIRLAKEAGFNMIRPWRKPPPPMWLDLAEEMGVLTVGSLAIECMSLPIESARLPQWVENEVRESILRDRNRTSVVQWELFNELARPVLKQMLHPMAMLARELDPTRLILDESGGWAQGANLYLPYESTPTKFNDIHNYPGPQVDEQIYRKLAMIGEPEERQRTAGLIGPLPGRNVIPGLMSFVSELGYGSLPDLVASNERFAEIGNPIVPPTVYHRRLARQHVSALQASGLDRIYPDLQRFCLDQQRLHGIANKRMIEAVRTNPNVIGYCIHALAAGDWIIGAGLLDMFRNPKTYAYEATREANQPRILAIRVIPRNVYAERGATLEITGVNDLAAVDGELRVEVTGADGKSAFSNVLSTGMDAGIRQILSEKLDTRTLSGTFTVKAQVVADDGAVIAANTYEFDIFSGQQLSSPKNRIAVLDPNNSLKPFLDASAINYVEFDRTTALSTPVFVSRTVADTPEQKARFADLVSFVERGGAAVYLGGVGPGQSHMWYAPKQTSPLLPVSYRLKAAKGLWTCIPHIVVDHPVFDGLPVNRMMGPIYENVWTNRTLLDVGGEVIVGTVGFDWHPAPLLQRHYYGPGDTWWGVDVTRIPHGKGRILISQLRLVENLGKDPVADKILYNLIRHSHK
jgi:beta-galactosidase